MTVTDERPPHPIRDAELFFGIMAKIHSQLETISDSLDDDSFIVDMYGDDPGGVFGIIQANPFKPSAAAPIFINYNGPYIIDTVLATWGLGQPGQSAESDGNVTSPAAGATITSVLLVPGTYQINWQVGLAGTVTAATELNNFQLNAPTSSGVVTLQSVNPGAIGGPYVQETVDIVTVSALTTVAVKNIALGTVGAVYSAQLVAIPIGNPQTVVLQLKDRTFQCTPGTGIFNPQDLTIQMDRDDLISLIVTPKQPCHLEIIGHVDRRRHDYV